jgi:hypothetical protein
MTDLLTTDTYDSGEIVRLNQIAETVRMDVGQTTRNLAPWEAELPPALRRSDLTDEQPLYDPTQTVQFALPAEAVTEVLAIQGPQSPPPPIPPNPGPVLPPRHALNERVGEYPVVRPSVPPAGERMPRGRHRAGHSGAWWLVTGAGIVFLAEAVGLLALLVVTR